MNLWQLWLVWAIPIAFALLTAGYFERKKQLVRKRIERQRRDRRRRNIERKRREINEQK